MKRAARIRRSHLLNESGHVAEGATCNLFMVRKGQLITPAVTENVLEGITRDSIMELAARELGLEMVERPIDRSELYICDELFLTGTAVGVAPVTRVDHRPGRGWSRRRGHAQFAPVVRRRHAWTHGRVPQMAAAGLSHRSARRARRGAHEGNELGLSPCRRSVPTLSAIRPRKRVGQPSRRRDPGKEETPMPTTIVQENAYDVAMENFDTAADALGLDNNTREMIKLSGAHAHGRRAGAHGRRAHSPL